MPVSEIARTFGVDWPHLAAQALSFSIVCLLLYRFAYAPVLKMLDARRQQIAQGLANTEKINAELAQIDRERQDILAAAHAESTRLITEARTAAKRLSEQETIHARVLGQQLMLRARDEAEQERKRVMTEVRREAARLVVKTTRAVAGTVLTDADQRRLAAEALKKIA
jgi:F-type H+-transporting ATPase subunit b